MASKTIVRRWPSDKKDFLRNTYRWTPSTKRARKQPSGNQKAETGSVTASSKQLMAGNNNSGGTFVPRGKQPKGSARPVWAAGVSRASGYPEIIRDGAVSSAGKVMKRTGRSQDRKYRSY